MASIKNINDVKGGLTRQKESVVETRQKGKRMSGINGHSKECIEENENKALKDLSVE